MGASARLRGPRELIHGLALAGLAAALSALTPATLAAPPMAAAKPAVCLIEPDSVAEVGSQVVGLVEKLHVERGQEVRAGQPLVSLRAEVERANAGVADMRARVDAEVHAAAATLDLAHQKWKRAQALVRENFVSDQALEQARGERELAAQRLAQARGQQQIWQQERRVADAQLGLRSVRSPLTGVVVERYVNLGERVEERPLVRVAVIDPLRVEVMVPTALYGRIQRGSQLTVRPELPGQEPVNATVRQVDRVLDAASNTFRVRLSLPNPDHRLPAGLRCKVDLPAAAQAAVVPEPAHPGRPAVGRATSPSAKAAPVDGRAHAALRGLTHDVSAVPSAPATAWWTAVLAKLQGLQGGHPPAAESASLRMALALD